MDVEFEGLEMDRETDYGLRKDDKLITTFEDAPYIYFKDHMAPYRGMMSGLKDESTSIKNEEVSRLFRSSTKKKLLVAASGPNFDDEARKTICFAIKYLIGSSPKEIVPVDRSPWVVVLMEKKAQVEELIKQKVSL
jgi:hypothetical protein